MTQERKDELRRKAQSCMSNPYKPENGNKRMLSMTILELLDALDTAQEQQEVRDKAAWEMFKRGAYYAISNPLPNVTALGMVTYYLPCPSLAEIEEEMVRLKLCSND